MPGNWINKAIKKPGALRKYMSKKQGQNISAKKLEKANHMPGRMGQRARMAETLKKLGAKNR